MAVVATPSPPRAEAAAAPGRPAAAAASRTGTGLLVALLGVLLYALFAGGAAQLIDEMRAQLALVALAVVAAGAWARGAIRVPAGVPAWLGPALLLGFAAWSGLSLLWSVSPAATWEELNRALAYALAAGLGVVVGAAAPRAVERAAGGTLVVLLVVALYALGGKVLPSVFEHAESISRLRAPLEYWNALGLACAMGVPLALRHATATGRRPVLRLAAPPALVVLLVTAGLTYSRGALLAVAVALVAAVWLGGARVRALAVAVPATVLAGAVLAWAYSEPRLAESFVPLDDRIAAGARFAGVLAVALGLAVAGGWALLRAERRWHWRPSWGRWAGRLTGAAAAAALVLVIAAAAASERGVTGVVRDAADSFTTQSRDELFDPDRLVSASSGNRWAWWQEAAGAWSDRPVSGWGAGSFPVTHRLYRRNQLDVQQPHSVPLEFLAETGAVGALLGFGGVLALLAVATAGLRRLGRGAQRDLGAAAVAAGAAWTVHAAFDWDWDIPGVTFPALVLLGVVAGRAAVATPGPPRPASRLGLGWLAGVALLAGAVAVSVILPAWAEDRTDAAFSATGGPASDERLEEAAAAARLAAELNPVSAEPLFAAAAIDQRRGRRREARDHLLEAVRRAPNDAGAWRRLALVSLTLADYDAVLRATRRLTALDPLSTQAAILRWQALVFAAPPSRSPTATGTPLPPAPVAPVPPAAPPQPAPGDG